MSTTPVPNPSFRIIGDPDEGKVIMQVFDATDDKDTAEPWFQATIVVGVDVFAALDGSLWREFWTAPKGRRGARRRFVRDDPSDPRVRSASWLVRNGFFVEEDFT